MRLLNGEEQALCIKILDGNGHNNYLGNIIDHQLEGVCISVLFDTGIVNLEFTIQNQFPTDKETEHIIERVSQISIEILTAVNLINILEKDGYIMLLQRANQMDNHSKFGRCISNLPSVTYQFPYKAISNLLKDY